MTTETVESTIADIKTPIRIIVAVSAAAFALLLWILYFREPVEGQSDGLSFMPALNAGLNATSTAFLLTGYTCIRLGKVKAHMTCMITSMLLSVAFLTCYLIYHSLHGNTPYPAEGGLRTFYYFVLITHIGVTVFALPLIITTFFLAFTRRHALHKKVARITLPLWLYVSVTGVAIFFLLRMGIAAAGG